MTLKQYFKIKRKEINKGLRKCLPKTDSHVRNLYKSMNYSLFSNGKRIRPILMYAVYESLNHHKKQKGIDKKAVCATACTIEIVHTSSLMLDDFPCMDNDATRRGKKTNHLVFGEAISLLAADSLLTYAYELLSREVPGKLGLELTTYLSRAVGTYGMIGGQMVDLQYRGKDIDYKTLIYIHTHKTASLFEFSARAGALLANATPKQADIVVKYANDLGLAYQITDDIQDVIEAGKIPPPNHPGVNFVSVLGIDKSRQKVEELIHSSITHLGKLNYHGDILEQMARYIEKRAYQKIQLKVSK